LSSGRAGQLRVRELVATEAARLLYHGSCKEYIEAKRAAARSLGAKILPKNSEVAMKLLEYALSIEGEGYWERLERLRRDALAIMNALAEFDPRLVGSVWRGIVKPHSDIDIEVDCLDPEPVKRRLIEEGYEVLEEGYIDVPEPLRFGSLWRIRVRTKLGNAAEVILKEHSWYVNPPRCDVFGDVKRGLRRSELAKTLEESPHRLFVPEPSKMRDLEGVAR